MGRAKNKTQGGSREGGLVCSAARGKRRAGCGRGVRTHADAPGQVSRLRLGTEGFVYSDKEFIL